MLRFCHWWLGSYSYRALLDRHVGLPPEVGADLVPVSSRVSSRPPGVKPENFAEAGHLPHLVSCGTSSDIVANRCK